MRRGTLTVIDERGPNDSLRVQFSNFRYYQDRETGDVVLFLSRYGERDAESWKLADAGVGRFHDPSSRVLPTGLGDDENANVRALALELGDEQGPAFAGPGSLGFGGARMHHDDVVARPDVETPGDLLAFALLDEHLRRPLIHPTEQWRQHVELVTDGRALAVLVIWGVLVEPTTEPPVRRHRVAWPGEGHEEGAARVAESVEEPVDATGAALPEPATQP